MSHKNIKLHNDLLQLAQQQQFGKIKKIYQSHKARENLNNNIWNLFADANSRLGDYKDVAHCCRKITQLEPENYHAMYNYALALQHLNNTDEALTAYEQCIAINQQYFSAYANCALLYQAIANYDKAIQYFLQALALNNNAEVRIALAQTYVKKGDTSSAIELYKKIVAETPDNIKARFYLAQLYYETNDYINSEIQYLRLYAGNNKDIKVINNLGRLYEESENLDKAIEFYNLAMSIDVKSGILQRNIARVFHKKYKITDQQDCLDKAIQAYHKAIETEPESPEPYFDLGRIYQQLKQTEQAIKYFTQAINMDMPEGFKKADEFILAARYFLSSVSNPADFDTDKKSYIANLFDGYADKFDDHLVQKLEYKTPELIAEKLAEFTRPETRYEIIDLGCGTGLCAPFLSKRAKKLTGIDLSEKMIEKAELLNLYDHLIVGDITEEMLASESNYDLVIAADVFVYIGKLDDVFHACAQKMNRDGLFIYSTERLEDGNEPYRHVDSGRCKHAVTYLNQLADKYGFEILANEPCLLRKEYGKPITGTLSVLKK